MIDIKSSLKNIDYIILGLVLILMFWGVLNIYSASFHEYKNLYLKQLFYVFLSIFIMLSISFLDYRKFIHFSIVFYVIGLLLLIAVKLFGVTILGAKRWINIGFMVLQPSEFFKFIMIALVSEYLGNKELPIKLKDIFIILILLAIPFILIKSQPDLGTALSVAFPVLFILFLAGINRWIIIVGILSIIILSPFVWFHLADYQKDRIKAFLNPESDPLGSAYHIIQSKIAVGSGQLFGKGFLEGTQSKYYFLPEQHTDFIFATIGEEWGFVISSILVLIYLILGLRIFYFGYLVKDKTAKFFCYGTASLILMQSFINIAMNTGLAPVVGIPLPFVSYGGSSLLTFSILIGTVLSIIRIYKKEKLHF
ncbi:rod shape-determining protein RodA [Venenivibrio stagnispumantis]|uniref:Peptidoglycan glycosyltransferase RodA n=1 Tax=Venenivibrio stagnispumantis TaxID=407998 RepID=A0AA46ACR7_9AQUI|nr:rod shape-determining protein RodA [Venenivibrio stagnispumantis]MCW4572616.1 rod shape-determining protein RodA [Venenivibrio stagnispumantis]SMP00592.1 rod shape determining protein RodA [Venenivibrio stagnispumantis]